MAGTGPHIDGALNLRDVGGLPAGDSVTRHGVLWRSGSLSRLSDAGREQFAALGIRRVIDLREDDEIAFEPSRTGDLGVETVRAPLFLGSTASFFAEDISLASMYRALVDSAADRLAEVVWAVAADAPALVHCTVGKDRTGLTVALILSAVGVDRDAVIADYARTETLLPPERNARVVAHLRAQHPGAQHLEELATRSPAPVMRDLLRDLDERFGSPTDYLRAQGVTPTALTSLRSMLVR